MDRPSGWTVRSLEDQVGPVRWRYSGLRQMDGRPPTGKGRPFAVSRERAGRPRTTKDVEALSRIPMVRLFSRVQRWRGSSPRHKTRHTRSNPVIDPRSYGASRKSVHSTKKSKEKGREREQQTKKRPRLRYTQESLPWPFPPWCLSGVEDRSCGDFVSR